jgi:hypothetical protein
MDYVMKTILPVVSLFLVLGCQSAPLKVTCNQTDWFELGRQDGASGLSSRLKVHREECGKFFDKMNEGLYATGYNNGLTEYCSSDNGFAIGKSGLKPTLNCPPPMDQTFLAAIQRGQEARDLEENIRRLDREISSLNQKLKTKRAIDKDSLLTKISGLQEERAVTERKFNQIERQIN